MGLGRRHSLLLKLRTNTRSELSRDGGPRCVVETSCKRSRPYWRLFPRPDMRNHRLLWTKGRALYGNQSNQFQQTCRHSRASQIAFRTLSAVLAAAIDLAIFTEGNHFPALLGNEILEPFRIWATRDSRYSELQLGNIVVVTLPQPVIVSMIK